MASDLCSLVEGLSLDEPNEIVRFVELGGRATCVTLALDGGVARLDATHDAGYFSTTFDASDDADVERARDALAAWAASTAAAGS